MVSVLASTFGPLDWGVVGAYMLLVLGLGVLFSRRQGGPDEFFLGGRRMPMVAVAISVLATMQSAATFIGGPEQSYAGDLTYLAAHLGNIIAAVLVAVIFLPAFYHHKVTSIYELLGIELGSVSQRATSAMFMVGRLVASGTRLFIVAIPFSLIAFNRADVQSMALSIGIIAAVAIAYTLAGGIRAVIWTDVIQVVLYVGTAVLVLLLLLSKIPLEVNEIVGALRATEGEKLRIIDARLDLTNPEFFQRRYSLWAIVFGLTLLNLAALGTDQDLTQRMLTCRSTARGSWSAILSQLIGWPVVALFLVLGVLLYVFYQRPDIMGDAAPAYAIEDPKRVFVDFLLNEIPAGLRGLMLAGLFAAAMSSLDSALTALASTAVADFYRPWSRRRRGGETNVAPGELLVSRMCIAVWGLLLALMALVCVFWHRRSGEALIDFALGVMVFAYAGMLGVFLTALLTRRGNTYSVLAALLAGFGAVVFLGGFELAFAWKMVIATGISFAICCVGGRR